MSIKGYTTETEVETDLGVTFTATQQAQVAALIEDAEAYIDAYTGSAWLTGQVTSERHLMAYDGTIWLQNAPVTSVQSITGRQALSTQSTVLTAGTHYEIVDARTGRVYIPGWESYAYLDVAYTPANTVPRLVNKAARLLVEGALQTLTAGGAGNIKSFSAFGQVSVTFRDETVPPEVKALLDLVRGPVLA